MKDTFRILFRLLVILATLAGIQASAEDESQAWVAEFTSHTGVKVGVTSVSLANQTFPELASLSAKGLTLRSFSAVLSTDYEEAERDNYTVRYIIRYRGIAGGKTITNYSRGSFATSLAEAYDQAAAMFKSEAAEIKAKHEAVVLDSISIMREKIAAKAE